jgi:hypothetical protein
MLLELHGLNERCNQAWLEKDAATVERLMADDNVYVAPSMRFRSRTKVTPRKNCCKGTMMP